MQAHNSKHVEIVRTCHFLLTWRFPMFLLTRVLGFEERPAAKVARSVRRTVIDSWFNPVLGRRLFRDRISQRRLRYLGNQWAGPGNDDPVLRVGQIYTAELFNGATYKITGRDKRIGLAYFEYVDS